MNKLLFQISQLKKKRTSNTRHSTIAEDRKHILTAQSEFYLREAYKALRTNVNFALTDTENCKVILVTSALQSEGKSLTALNLAISIAQTEAKVLIIDCDLRRPKLHRLLGANANNGLSNLLMDPKKLNITVNKFEPFGISVLLAGDIPPNPSELLASARMQALLNALRTRFDYIIIDSPPVNMVIDSVVLAPLTDGVLFIVKADQSERGEVLHALEQMKYAKAKVLGYVFNGMKAESSSGYGKYRYSKYRRYGYHYKYNGYGYQTKAETVPSNQSEQQS